MADEEKYAPPEISKADVAHTLVKAGISSIPGVGGAAAELFALVITPPLDKRRAEWMNSIAEGLESLEGKVEGFRIEDLPKNEAFISTVMHASQAAIRNHQNEKLEALRNAVLNVAIGNAPNEDVQLMFVNLIDSFTPWHMRILRFFQNPEGYGAEKGLTTATLTRAAPALLLERFYPELGGNRAFYDLIITDLHARGLFSMDTLHVTMTAHGLFSKRATGLGDAFLSFITSPV